MKELLNKEKIEEKLLKETGRYYDGESIIEEIEEAAGREETGAKWVIGQDDILQKWEYYVIIREKNFGEQIEREIELFEIRIENKKTGKVYHVDMKEEI